MPGPTYPKISGDSKQQKISICFQLCPSLQHNTHFAAMTKGISIFMECFQLNLQPLWVKTSTNALIIDPGWILCPHWIGPLAAEFKQQSNSSSMSLCGFHILLVIGCGAHALFSAEDGSCFPINNHLLDHKLLLVPNSTQKDYPFVTCARHQI